MRKKVIWISIVLIILLGGIIMSLQYVIQKPNAMFSDEEILETLSKKSGIDFQCSTIQKVEEIDISDSDSGIYVILQIDEAKKTLIEAEITQMRHKKLETDDNLFPKMWKKNIKGVTDYACYEIYNGARKQAKSLNITTCLFVSGASHSLYTVYVYYAGD